MGLDPLKKAGATVAKPAICDICKQEFPSKSKLFNHLTVHGYENTGKVQKVVLLVGYISPITEDSNDWISDNGGNGNNSRTWRDPSADQVEKALIDAIQQEDSTSIVIEEKQSNNNEKLSQNSKNGISNKDTAVESSCEGNGWERPKGLSRASNFSSRASMMLSTEPTCHAACDTFVLPLKQGKIKSDLEGIGEKAHKLNREWINKVNSFLPSDVRVLHVYAVPSSGVDLNAESNCTQRRYEYVIPLNLLMPADTLRVPTEVIVRKKKESLILGMDVLFPIDTEEGQARIESFRKLKALLKKFLGRRSCHNFVTGGASPDEHVAVRRIDRYYHKGLQVHNGETYVVFSLSADSMLRGQVRKMIGLVLGICRGWIPEWYLDAALPPIDSKLAHEGVVADIPSAPGFAAYLAECRYPFWETKFEHVGLRIDPRRQFQMKYLYEYPSEESVYQQIVEGTRKIASAVSVIEGVEEELDDEVQDVDVMTEDVPEEAAATTQTTTRPIRRGKKAINNKAFESFYFNDEEIKNGCESIKDWTYTVQSHIFNVYDVKGSSWLENFQKECEAVVQRYEAVQKFQCRTPDELQTLFKNKYNHAPSTVTVVNPELLASDEKKDDGYGAVRLKRPHNRKKDKEDKKDQNRVADDVDPTNVVDNPTPDDAAITTDRNIISHDVDEMQPKKKKKKVKTDASGENTVVNIPSMESTSRLHLQEAQMINRELELQKINSIYSPPKDRVKYNNCKRWAFNKVLELLRAADSSGAWPLSSLARQKVMDNDSLVEKGGNGGTFSVGCLPKSCAQPKGNVIFPGNR